MNSVTTAGVTGKRALGRKARPIVKLPAIMKAFSSRANTHVTIGRQVGTVSATRKCTPETRVTQISR